MYRVPCNVYLVTFALYRVPCTLYCHWLWLRIHAVEFKHYGWRTLWSRRKGLRVIPCRRAYWYRLFSFTECTRKLKCWILPAMINNARTVVETGRGGGGRAPATWLRILVTIYCEGPGERFGRGSKMGWRRKKGTPHHSIFIILRKFPGGRVCRVSVEIYQLSEKNGWHTVPNPWLIGSDWRNLPGSLYCTLYLCTLYCNWWRQCIHMYVYVPLVCRRSSALWLAK